MKKAFLTTVIIGLLSGAIGAEEWVLYETSETGIRFLWKPSTVERLSEAIVKVWERVEESSESKIESLMKRDSEITREILIKLGYGEYAGTLKLWHMNCETREVSLKVFIDYSKDINELLRVKKKDDELQFTPLMPNSITEALYQLVCP